MHSTNFDAKISKQFQYNDLSKTIQNNIKLFPKKRATHVLQAIMGAPRTNYFNEYTGEAKILGNKFLPSTKFCERSEHIKFFNSNNIGVQNA